MPASRARSRRASSSSSPSGSATTAAGAGLLAGFFGLGGWRKPYPAASVRQASVARPVVSITTARVHPLSTPPASQVGSRIMASPTTPPRPAGNGQPVPRGSAAAQPAASATPTIQNITRRPSRHSARWVISRQPQMAIGRTIAIAAMPNSCISRSATTAPGTPSMLRIGALVAWLSDGSLTDQVASASAKRQRQQDQRHAAEFAQPAAELLAQRIGQETEALKAAFDCPHAVRPSRLGPDAAAGPRRGPNLKPP